MLSLAVPAGVRSLVIEVGLVGHEGCRDFISVCERSFAGLRGHFGMLAEGGALDRDYTVWFEEHRATPELLVRQRERLAAHPGPLVSIVIPSRDHADLLEACASSILQKTEYSNFEIVVVENGSENPETFELYGRLQEDGRVRVVTWTPDLLAPDAPTEHGFNYSALVNFGAAHACGEHTRLRVLRRHVPGVFHGDGRLPAHAPLAVRGYRRQRRAPCRGLQRRRLRPLCAPGCFANSPTPSASARRSSSFRIPQ